jgi:uncharacterized membrane protein
LARYARRPASCDEHERAIASEGTFARVTLHEFLDLLVRWVHLIAGIMWIGNSMLFNWLDRNLEKAAGREKEVGYEGKMWMVHSGGFYEVEKKQLAPGQLPEKLHWFKW